MAQIAGIGRIGLDKVRGFEAAGNSGGCVTSQLKSDGLAGEWIEVRIGSLDRVGETVFGVSEQWAGLLVLIGGIKTSETRIRHQLCIACIINHTNLRAAPITNRGLFEYVAVCIYFQCERMLDAWIGRVALVVVAECFQRMGEEDGMPVDAPCLKMPDAEVLFGDGVRRLGTFDLLCRCGRAGIIGIHLLAQHRAFEGAAGLALFLQRQAAR